MNDQEMNAAVEEILKGSFDLHVHAGPDPVKPRRLDALDTARAAYEAEMAGFVLKSHEYPTTSLAYALNRMYPGLDVTGSVTLNPSVGGLNPEAVQIAADMDARVVWMPTSLKEEIADRLKARAEELGIPNLPDMIADETIGITEEEILPFLQEKGHPALSMESILG